MRLLFVCVHNAGRSQMAEAFAKAIADEQGLDVIAESAGTLGAGKLNPVAVEAMEEIGVSLGDQTPKQLTREMVQRADKIVSMGCGVDGDACPAKFIVTEDWGLDDPADQSIERVREIRDQIRQRVLNLVAGIKPG